MSGVVEIPGGSATLRDEWTVRGRTAYLASMMALPIRVRRMIDEHKGIPGDVEIPFEDTMALARVNEVMVWALLESWTLDRPMPTLDTIGDLPPSILDPLLAAVAPKLADEMTRMTQTGPAGSTDPESPTGPSGT